MGTMWDQWNSVFRESLGQAERILVSELRTVRNQWAHNTQFNSNDAVRALDSMERLLSAVSAGDQAAEVGQMRMDLMRVASTSSAGQEMRKEVVPADRGQAAGRPEALARGGHAAPRRRLRPLPAGRVRRRPVAGLPERGGGRVQAPHRVLPPHVPHRGAEPAADASAARGWPARAETRSSSCRPISAAARRTRCWRSITCFPGTAPANLPGVEELVKEARRPDCRRTSAGPFSWAPRFLPGKPHKKPDGTVVRTLWGEMAWQLGGKEGYELVKRGRRDGRPTPATP